MAAVNLNPVTGILNVLHRHQGCSLPIAALHHFHLTLLVRPSGSLKTADSLTPSSGCSVDRVTVPASSTLVTVTTTSRVAVLPRLSLTTTVTL